MSTSENAGPLKCDSPAMDFDINGTRNLMECYGTNDGICASVQQRHVRFGAKNTTAVGIDGVYGCDFIGVHDLGVTTAPTFVVDVEEASAIW